MSTEPPQNRPNLAVRHLFVVHVAGVALAALTLLPAGTAVAQPGGDAVAPVTDAMMQDPDPADWLMWRRTLDSWGYSPLDAIDRQNVGELRMVWSRALTVGRQQGTPLVYDGVMYMPNPRDVIQAIDAVTGDMLWEHRRDRPDDLETYIFPTLSEGNRNLAIHGDLIIDTSNDDYVYALDAATGRLVWDTQVLDYRTHPRAPDFRPNHRQREGRLWPRLHPSGWP